MPFYKFSTRNNMLLKNLDEALCYYQTELLPVMLVELNICRRALDPALGLSNEEIAQIFVSGGHQQRVTKDPVVKELAKHPNLWTSVYTSFDALYNDVERSLESIHRCGELTCYDVAKRIGCIRGLMPEKVFVCSVSVKEAAEKFLGRACGFGAQLPVSDFAPLKPLTAMEIENFLCIFSKHLIPGGIHMAAENSFDNVCYETFYEPELLAKLKLCEIH